MVELKTMVKLIFNLLLQNWSSCPAFTLSTQTSKGLILTLRSHAALTNELLSEGYKFVMAGCFQSDPSGRKFFRMNGRGF